jgi:hypothetical protein
VRLGELRVVLDEELAALLLLDVGVRLGCLLAGLLMVFNGVVVGDRRG